MARHPGAVKRATSYAERLRLGIALIHGDHDKVCESELDDGRNSPPPPDVETRTTAFTLGLEYLPGTHTCIYFDCTVNYLSWTIKSIGSQKS